VGDYLDAEKQQDKGKRAPTEIRDNRRGSLFSHNLTLCFKFLSASSYKVEGTDHLSLITSHFSSNAALAEHAESGAAWESL